jgi:hypothetical protein
VLETSSEREKRFEAGSDREREGVSDKFKERDIDLAT